MGYRRITVGVNGSISSLAALRAALDAVRAGGLRELHVVHAWSLPVVEVGVHGATPDSLDHWRRQAEERVTTAFQQALGGEPDDVLVRLHLVPGPPGPVLVGSVAAPDLLVVGAGDGGPVRRTLSGSPARYCVSRAPCPVLVVPPPELLSARRRPAPAAERR